MTPQEAAEANKAVDSLLESLANLVVDAMRGRLQHASDMLDRWKRIAPHVLAEKVGAAEADRLRLSLQRTSRRPDTIEGIHAEVEPHERHLLTLKDFIRQFADQIPGPTAIRRMATETPRRPLVFIIHGKDERNTEHLQELLKRQWNIPSVILREEPAQGRTLVEKFEEVAQHATYAAALYTPDDFVEADKTRYAQARPNVIFELGWFYGRLGRHCTCILYQEGTNIPTDLEGISRIQFARSIEEKVGEIERELKAANLIKTPADDR